MSFIAVVATYPNNRDSEMFGPVYEDDSDFFDQYLTFSPSNSATQEYSHLPEEKFIEYSTSDINTDTLLTFPDDKESSEQHSWQDASWASGLALPAAENNSFYTELSGRAAISDSELLTLEGITLDSPTVSLFQQLSVPSSPSPIIAAATRRRSRLAESLSHTFKKVTSSFEKPLRSPIRKQSSITKVNRHVNHSQAASEEIGNELTMDESKFKFDFEDDPTSIKVEDNSSMTPIGEEDQDVQINGFKTAEIPLNTPELCGRYSRNDSETTFPVTPELNTSPFWTQTAGSPTFSGMGNPSMYPPPAGSDAPVWWAHASTTPLAQPLPIGLHTNPQLATKSLALQLQNQFPYETNERRNLMNMGNGIMIQIPQLSLQQAFFSENARIQRGYFDTSSQQQNHHSRRHSSKISLRQQYRLHQQSPRKTRSSEHNTPRSPSPSSQIRRHKSSKPWPRTPQTPGAGINVDFVNYTPDDSKIILTGVAPSGSSKTKARREKEAMEKRRKLSQAAARAIRAAGGDVGELVEQGLFV